MITELTDKEVIAVGARYRASYLVEQAGYTIGLAEAEGKEFTDYLPKGYLGEVTAERDTVSAAAQDKALLVEEAKETTRVHHSAFGDAKVLRRKTARLASSAKRRGKPIPDALVRIPQVRTAPALAMQLSNMLKLLEANQALLPGNVAASLIKEGKTLVADLQTADDAKELKHYSELPKAVQEFYKQKGLLYLGLKVINDAAQALHAGDAMASSRYTTSTSSAGVARHTPRSRRPSRHRRPSRRRSQGSSRHNPVNVIKRGQEGACAPPPARLVLRAARCAGGVARRDEPIARPDEPAARADMPAARADMPAARLAKPVINPADAAARRIGAVATRHPVAPSAVMDPKSWEGQ